MLQPPGDGGTLHPMTCLDRRPLGATLIAAACLLSACADDTSTDPTDGTTGMMTVGTTTDEPDDTTGTTGDTDAADSTTTMMADDTTSTTATVDESSSDGGSSSGTTGPGNQPPSAFHDGYAVLLGAGDLVVDAASGVLANDVDPDDDPISITASDAVSAQGGTVAVDADGAFTYTPPAGFWGEDSFAYSIEDSEGNGADGVVNIVVRPAIVDLGDVAMGQFGFRIDGTELAGEAGMRVADGGDVNGDGLDDIVIATTEAAGGMGQVWVVFGKDDGATVDLDDVALGMGGFTITNDATGEDFGISIDGGGDVNGDGLDDVIIGAPGSGNAGQAYVVHGKADGAEVTVADLEAGTGGFVLNGQVVGDDAGTAVAMVGDINGDGYDDVAVGAPFAGTVPDSGRTYIVHGRTETDSLALSDILGGMGGFVANGEGVDDQSGTAIDGGHDVNGDGLDDIVIGAEQADPNGGNSGAAYVVFGKTTGSQVNLVNPGSAGFAINGIAGLDVAGSDVSMPGDVNGDGRADVLVGASGAEDDVIFQGQAYVVFGKTDTEEVELSDVLAGDGGYGLDGEAGGNFLGLVTGGASDVDGDGFADLLFGCANADFAGPNAGRAYVVFGKSNGVRVEMANVSLGNGGIAFDGEEGVDTLGTAIAGGGDIDGDGLGDFIIGAPGSDAVMAESGSVYVVFGAGWRGHVDYVGTSGGDTYVGAPSGDGIVAGQGDDMIGGGGGSDVLYTGAGADTIELTSGQFFRINGGAGQDSLVITDADIVLNFVAIPNPAIVDIELIDLTGTGDNSLTMDEDDVRAVMGVSKVLQITGDTGDSVTIDLGDTWMSDGMAGGFDRYTNGLQVLEVSTELDADITL